MEDQTESTESTETNEEIKAEHKPTAEESKSFLDKAKDFVGMGSSRDEDGELRKEVEAPQEELVNKEPASTMEAPKPEAVIENIDELVEALSQLGIVNHMGHVNILKTMKANLKYQYKI